MGDVEAGLTHYALKRRTLVTIKDGKEAGVCLTLTHPDLPEAALAQFDF